MTYAEILQDIKNRAFKPLYFLHGEEPYFIDLVSDALETTALTEAERAFNQTVFYGKDTDAQSVLDTARRFPMMAPFQLVLLKEAQDMKSLKDLEPYILRPVPTTIIVICHKNGKYNLNSGFGKALKEHAVLLESKRLFDNQMPDWVQGYLQDRGHRIRPDASALVAEYLGAELSKAANELDKLIINQAPGREITVKEVEAQIGISKDFNVFELQKALGQRNVLKVNRIVDYFAANPKRSPDVVTFSALYNYFSKLYILQFYKNSSDKDQAEALDLKNSFFLKDYRGALTYFTRTRVETAISLLREYDLKAKGVGYQATGKEEGSLLRELCWKLLHIDEYLEGRKTGKLVE